MIRSVRATAGYAADLAALRGRTFDFEAGLTVLFGQNDSGKSTLLKLMAAYSACAEPGWSTYSSGYTRSRSEPMTFPQRFTRGARLSGSEAEVDWDGTPTHYLVGLPNMGQSSFNEALERGGDEADDHLRRIMRPGSAGEEVIHWLRRLETSIGKPPSLARDASFYVPGHGDVLAARVNSMWSESIYAFTDYVATLPRSGPVTLLLDEPDGHLSIPNQDLFWRLVVPRLSEGRQVVVASHSPFALRASRIVDLELGYSEHCRTVLGSEK